jgi:hypothetical protein
MLEAGNNMHWPHRRERLQGYSDNKSVNITNLKFAMSAYVLYHAMGPMTKFLRTVPQCGQPRERHCCHLNTTDTCHFVKLLISYASNFHKRIIAIKFCNAIIHILFSSWHYLFHNCIQTRWKIYKSNINVRTDSGHEFHIPK